MSEEQAKTEVLKLWRALPERDRRTTEQAADFAMQVTMTDDIKFKANAEQYQHIKGWLLNDLDLA